MTTEIVNICISLILMIGLVFCLRKGYLSPEAFGGVKNAVDSVADGFELTAESTVFEKLMKYARIAFHAAEQLAYVGKITAEERNTKALEMVEGFAAMEGLAYGDAEKETTIAALEAMCDMNGHSERQEEDRVLYADGYDVPMEQWPLEQIKCFLKDNDLGMPDTLPANEAECKVALLEYFTALAHKGEKVSCETTVQVEEAEAETESAPGWMEQRFLNSEAPAPDA